MSTDKLELQKELSLLQTDSDNEEGDWRKSNSSWTDNICQNSTWGVHKLKNSNHNRQQTPPKMSLLWHSGGGLCGHMILRAMLAVAYATGRASHAR
jgi:hypothetical protein